MCGLLMCKVNILHLTMFSHNQWIMHSGIGDNLPSCDVNLCGEIISYNMETQWVKK